MKIKCLVFIFITLVANGVFAENASPPFKVGVIIPLSGPYSSFGKAAITGLKMGSAKNKFNKISYIFEDSQYKSELSVRAFNKLKNIDKVNALIVLGTPPSRAISPLAKINNIPTYVWTASTEISKTYNNTLRLMSSGFNQGKIMAEEIVKREYQKIAFIVSENGYSLSVKNGLLKNIDKSKLSLLENFSSEENDFKFLINKLKKIKDIHLGLCLNTGQTQSFLKQFYQAKLKGEIFGCHSLSSNIIAETLNRYEKKLWFVEGKINSEFIVEFEKLQRDLSGIWIAAAFNDLAQVITPNLLNRVKDTKICLNKSALTKSCFKYKKNEKFLYSKLGIANINQGIFNRR